MRAHGLQGGNLVAGTGEPGENTAGAKVVVVNESTQKVRTDKKERPK